MEGHLLGGRYRLGRRLGEGGMGQVWEARDETLDRPVAVKVISLLAGGGTRGDEARARFLREARITARLQHPNIVTIHDLGESGEGEDKVPFLVMELVQGEGLDASLRRGAVAPPLVARWSAQICDALAAAHDAGIMHRDIKPSNVLVTPSGIVKVLDFGVARAADPAVTGDRLTRTGFIVGTPPYMAPEQARGVPELSSDLYAVGCLIFELLTGRLPFQAPDTVGYLSAHLTEEPPAPGSVSSGIPAAWDDLVLTLLHKEPARRYRDAAALAQALRRLDVPPEPELPVPAPTIPATIPATVAAVAPAPPAHTEADRYEAVKRFGPSVLLLALTLIAFPDWGPGYPALPLPVALLGCAAALTPRSGRLLRTVGYAAAVLEIGHVVGVAQGIAAGALTYNQVWGYGTVAAFAIATYVHRDITTRRRVTPTP
ncbi:serine/threonine-protein kinase [Streptomyces sp. NPDC001717]|uniref:serine/threonine-protein kinase n=1 Tax=Streptomyces sp. NPDC001717 TaxID=3364604 RepID=UPI003694AEA9